MGEIGEIAIFPLSNVVLFPRIQTPLHLFEPRYRQLAEQVLADDRRIGMLAVPPEHVHDLPGDPPVYPIGCAGSVADARRLPDGRFHIVLLGTYRFRVLGEAPRPPGRLYRVARIERLEDPYPDAQREQVAALRTGILTHFDALLRRSAPARAAALESDLLDRLDDVSFVNSLANALAFAPAEKQSLLEAASIGERFERLEGLLAFRVAEVRRPGRSGSDTVH